MVEAFFTAKSRDDDAKASTVLCRDDDAKGANYHEDKPLPTLWKAQALTIQHRDGVKASEVQCPDGNDERFFN